MATIIEFRARERSGDQQAATGELGPAQVLLFTGVRYERASDALEPVPVARPRPNSARKRDRLEIAD